MKDGGSLFPMPRGRMSKAQSGPQSVACEPSDVGAAAAFYSHGLCKIRQNRAGFYGKRMGRIKNNEAIGGKRPICARRIHPKFETQELFDPRLCHGRNKGAEKTVHDGAFLDWEPSHIDTGRPFSGGRP